MREVRPTIRVLKTLPRETFVDRSVWEGVKNRDWANLSLYGIDHPLLNDARSRFAAGVPDTHQVSTRAAGRRVFEVRDRSGAAWRGAVVLDDQGDPWLVYADRHDAFHATARNFFEAGSYLPIAAEYTLRDREEAAIAFLAWRKELLRGLAAAIVQAMRSHEEVQTTIAGHRTTDQATFEVSLEHDTAAGSVDEAHESSSLVTLVLRVRTRTADEFRQEVLNTVLPFLQPDPDQYESVFGRDGSMTHLITMSQGRLIQFAAAAPDTQSPTPADAPPPTCLHYVGLTYLTEAYIEGRPVRGVCGTWFVPTRDESAGLPVCPRCDAEKPIAEALLQLMRGPAD